jgi:hypothetical protein
MWQALEHWEIEHEIENMVKRGKTGITQEPIFEGSPVMRYLLTTEIKLYLSPEEFVEFVNKGAS